MPQTYRSKGESSPRAIRARPVAGQGLSTALKVECSETMRNAHPLGTKLLVKAKVTEAYGSTFLYTYYGWDYDVLTEQEARDYVKKSHNA